MSTPISKLCVNILKKMAQIVMQYLQDEQAVVCLNQNIFSDSHQLLDT